jgi:hypothetical protein
MVRLGAIAALCREESKTHLKLDWTDILETVVTDEGVAAISAVLLSHLETGFMGRENRRMSQGESINQSQVP